MYIRQLYFVFVISVVFCARTQGQVIQKCAEFGEYCQNHWDCCSNSCMSYLYRCTRGNNEIFPYLFLGTNYERPLPSTLNELLELNFSGGNHQVQQVSQRPTGVFTRFAADDENAIESTTPIPVATSTMETMLETTTITEKSQNTEVTVILKLANREQQSKPETVGETTTVKENLIGSESKWMERGAVVGQCKEIGAKCYSNDECCSKRCHGFLHQCVT